MLLYDQGLAQRDHEENPEQTSTECNQRNFNQGRAGDTPLGRPHEQRREGKDRACRDRFTSRADRLHHIIFKY